MLTATLAAALLTQGAPAPNPGALVSKMLARYHQAETATGTILFTQTAEGKSVSTRTTLQYERPSKLYIRQVEDWGDRREALAMSDGRILAYSVPPTLVWQRTEGPGQRLFDARSSAPLAEPVVGPDGKAKDLGELLAISSSSLLDKSPVLAIVLARLPDLKFFRTQWASVANEGVGQEEGKAVRLVGGDYRQTGNLPITGRYQMAITEAGDLVRYSVRERVAVDPSLPTIEVTNSWVVNVEVGAKPDPNLFRVDK